MIKDIIGFGNENLKARINLENGQLISLFSNNVEYFHSGGESSYSGPGWKNSEIVPYPIFGPPKNYQVKVDNKTFFLEQHGISRYLNWELIKKQKNSITLVQKYDGKKISNPKYSSNKGHPEFLTWLPFTLKKTFELKDESLVCTLKLTNDSNIDMPYMIGWHPAFKLIGDFDKAEFYDGKGTINKMKKVVQASNTKPETALVKEGVNSIIYKNANKKINVSSDNLNNTMVWSPNVDAGMFCIEHMTKVPIHDKRKHFENIDEFELIKPGESKTYSIKIKIN